jgi:hypothetical protein
MQGKDRHLFGAIWQGRHWTREIQKARSVRPSANGWSPARVASLRAIIDLRNIKTLQTVDH